MLPLRRIKENTIFSVDSNHSFGVHVLGNKGDGRYWCGPILCILGSLVPSRKDNGCSRFQQICWPQPSSHNTMMSLNSAVCTCMYVCMYVSVCVVNGIESWYVHLSLSGLTLTLRYHHAMLAVCWHPLKQ